MALLGRRQPHGPIILTGGRNQPPIGRIVTPRGAFASQQSARRPVNRVVINRAGGPSSVASIVMPKGAFASLASARRPGSKVIIKGIPVAPPPPAPPIGAIITPKGAIASQASARRPVTKTSILRAGGPPAIGRIVIKDRAAQAAVRLAYHPIFQPIIKPLTAPQPIPVPPIGAILKFGERVSQDAVRRTFGVPIKAQVYRIPSKRTLLWIIKT